jgi:hypothetical protein
MVQNTSFKGGTFYLVPHCIRTTRNAYCKYLQGISILNGANCPSYIIQRPIIFIKFQMVRETASV